MSDGARTNPARTNISRGALATLGGQLAKFVVQFSALVVLARLLDPSDYGLMAMVVVVVGFGEVFRDFGLSLAAVQAPSLSIKERDNLFWLNSAIGATLAILAVASSPLVAMFFDETRLTHLLQALSLIFILNGLATQYRASLNRNLRFGTLAIVDVSAQVAAFGIGVGFALSGAGYWALAAQQVGQAAVTLVLLALCSRWRPRRYDPTVKVRSFVRFGWFLMASQIVGYVSRNTDSVVIGHQLGPGPLGVYNRAFQLLMLPLNQINAPSTTVALPVLARAQGDRPEFDRQLLRGQAIMITVLCLIFSFLGAQSEQVVAVLFGAQWSAAAPIFAVLAVAGVFQAVSYATYWVFLARGLTSSNFKFSLLSRALVIALVIVGVHWGTVGVAAGYAAGVGFAWPLGTWWVSRYAGAPGGSMFTNGLVTSVCLGLVGATSLVGSGLAHDLPPVVQLMCGAAASAAALTIVYAAVPLVRRNLHMVWSMAAAAVARTKTEPS